jgi:hypothetical protein
MAIKNATIASNSPVTLIVPSSPQRFAEAQVLGPASDACPITKESVAGVLTYDVSLPKSSALPKLAPMVAVVGTASSNGVSLDNLNVKADLDRTGTQESFRACDADDGVHLTLWRGLPVTGTLVWSGYYYEAGNPRTWPACAAAELAPVSAPHA